MATILLSYRPDDDADYVEAFLGELCDAVRRVDGGRSSWRVHLATDDDIVGDEWTPRAHGALAECAILLAICSPRYFLTERCGREWWTFQNRLLHHETVTGRRPAAIVPVAWGENGLHGDLPAAEFTTDIASRSDVRALARLRSNRAPYRRLLDRLARHVVDVSRDDPVLPAVTRLPYRATPDAFRAAGGHHAYAAVVGGGSPPPAVRFVVAAGRRDEMAPVRNDVTYYGARRADWRPYLPEDPQALAVRARAVAADHLFDAEVVDDIESIVAVLEQADADDELVVMLVDAWLVHLAAGRRALAEVERRPGTAIAVVVPLNATDTETVRAREQLTVALGRLLASRSGRRDPLLRIGPDSTEEFGQALGGVLEAARSLTFRSAHVRRVAPGAPAGNRPLLDAP
ncbi:FxsC protein [Micromonospora sp. NPDC049497]|uniref:FxsC protein n=1 Tax=Micromonospora sp. NPDC049497 TaxID=3364273 RepID=UPI0037956EC0